MFSPRQARYGTFVVLGSLAGTSYGLASALEATVPRTATAHTPTTALRSRDLMDQLSPMCLVTPRAPRRDAHSYALPGDGAPRPSRRNISIGRGRPARRAPSPPTLPGPFQESDGGDNREQTSLRNRQLVPTFDGS